MHTFLSFFCQLLIIIILIGWIYFEIFCNDFASKQVMMQNIFSSLVQGIVIEDLLLL